MRLSSLSQGDLRLPTPREIPGSGDFWSLPRFRTLDPTSLSW